MKHKTILVAVLAMAMLSTMFLVTTANAVAFPNLPSTPVNVVFQEGPDFPITGRLPGTATLSNVPASYDVTNKAYYPAYCSELGTPITQNQMYLALLTTSPLGHTTPLGPMTQAQWNEVNYLINNHPPSLDLQFAIWFVLGFTDADLNAGSWNQAGSYATAHSYANDAITNGAGFTPSNPGQLVAVFVDMVDQNLNDLPIQDLIIQLTIPPQQLTPGFTPGFWKHDIEVRLSHAPYNEGLTKSSYNAFSGGPLDGVKLTDARMDSLLATVNTMPGFETLTFDQALANLKLPGWSQLRTDTANAFNAAAGYGPYV